MPLLLLRFPLALWVGGSVLAAMAAPVIFAAVPSRETAGCAFGEILRRFEGLKHGLSLALVIGVFQGVSRAGRVEGSAVVAAIAIFLAIATNVYLSMVLRPRMGYFRKQAGSFDEIPEDDPWRRKFGHLHRRSVRVSMFGLLCAVVALWSAP
jgi:hypothetical protein